MTFIAPQRGLSPARGLTLVEMLLVVSIIGILAGSVVVSFAGRREGHALRAATEELAAAIRFAEAQSRLQGIAHRVWFDRRDGAFRVERLRDGVFVAVAGRAGRERRPIEGVRITGTIDALAGPDPALTSLVFDPRGERFTGRVGLKARDGLARWIDVAAETGQVQIDGR